ncbi:MAG: carotenoid biosynthesis protein [Albidovulum sp.]|uniref:carotenoid biosynthesis protein n=1 Tax=Albidovulum sp. TaxID=1872424 RepID=UPI003CBE941A
MKNGLIWVVVALYAAFAAAKPLLAGTDWFVLVPLVSILAPIVFVLLHAPRQIGWANLGVFFALAFVISWSYESLSIATGFPFGHYHYTEDLGWQLGTVPLLIMPAYFGVCYISWHIARTLTDALEPGQSFGWPVVLVASFVMVMWDLSMDPSRATVNLTWIWHDGGAYFGVPFVNFAGWFLCVATIFAAFAFWLSRSATKTVATPDRIAQAQALGLYVGLIAEFISFAVLGSKTGTVTDAVGQVWNLRDIYESLGLVSIFTMGFVIVLTALKLAAPARDGAR